MPNTTTKRNQRIVANLRRVQGHVAAIERDRAPFVSWESWCCRRSVKLDRRHTDVDILRLQRGGEKKGKGQGDECLRVSFWGWHRCQRQFRVGERWSRGHRFFPGSVSQVCFWRMRPARGSELLLGEAEWWLSFTAERSRGMIREVARVLLVWRATAQVRSSSELVIAD
jgi:hypothetical protein